MRRDDGMDYKTEKLGGTMDLEEYKRRVENMHSVTGVPTYWEELQAVTAERDKYQYIAKMFYDNRYILDLEQLKFAAEEYEKVVRGE